MAYRIERTDKADEQLWEVILYRADVTGRADAAIELLNLMESSINQLSTFPEMGSWPKYSALRRHGFRVLVVEKFLVFYKVDREQQLVTVHAVVDGRRDYMNLI